MDICTLSNIIIYILLVSGHTGGAAIFEKDPPFDSRVVLRGSTVQYECPESQLDDDQSLTNSSIFFFLQSDLVQLCLQSGPDNVLIENNVQVNLSGIITCYQGSCEVGTRTIHEIHSIQGRLNLEVDYPPTRQPTTGTIVAGQALPCPFEAKPAANYTFYKDRGGDYSCNASNVCRLCNASCGASDPSHRDPSVLQEKCEADTGCFYKDFDDLQRVIIAENCLGCLTCTATNVIDGVSYTASYHWMVDTTKPTKMCNWDISDPRISVLPESNFVPGRDQVKMTVQFVSNAAYNYLVVLNGTPFSAEDHNVQIDTVASTTDCLQTITLTWDSPGPQDTGFYQIYVSSAFDKIVLNATLQADMQPTEMCDESYCSYFGQCHQLVGSQDKYCECVTRRHGGQCQYDCPVHPQIKDYFSLCVGCEFSSRVMCDNSAIKPGQENDVTWEQDGKSLPGAGQYLTIYIPNAVPSDASNYSCFLKGLFLASTVLKINSEPFLNRTLQERVLKGCSDDGCNASVNYPVSFPIDPLVYPLASFNWMPSGESASERSPCVVQGWLRDLVLLQQDRCSGQYTGVATNTYGSVSFSIVASPSGPNPPTPSTPLWKKPAFYGSTAGGVGILIGIIFTACFHRLRKPEKPFDAVKDTNESRSSGIQAVNEMQVATAHTQQQQQSNERTIRSQETASQPSDSADEAAETDALLPDEVTATRPRQPEYYPTFTTGSLNSSTGSLSRQLDIERVESTPIRPGERRSFEDGISSLPPLNLRGSSLMLESAGDESRLCHLEVEQHSKPGRRNQPKRQFLDTFTVILHRTLSLKIAELASESIEFLAENVLRVMHDKRQPADRRVQAFIEFWADSDEATFWELFNVVCAVLTPDHADFAKKLRENAERLFSSEYYRHGKPEAAKCEMSTISQAFSHDQATPPFMSRPAKSGKLASPLTDENQGRPPMTFSDSEEQGGLTSQEQVDG